MDAKEAIERLNEFVWQQANGYSIHIANGGQDNDEFELLMDDLRLAISALEKVPVLEAESVRLQKYNDTLIADNNLLRNELDAQDLLAHDDDIEFAEIKHKMETLEAENARLREKETPKEPTNKFTDIDEQGFEVECGGCPNCKMEVNFDDNEYCPYCGQKLNWSSDKE